MLPCAAIARVDDSVLHSGEETNTTDGDLFRIRIWGKDDGDWVVYDNMVGAPSSSDPTTALGGGSIVIHTGKGPK